LHAAPTVTGFTLRALGLLPFAFVVWYFAAPVLLFPVVLLLRGIALVAFSGLVTSIEQSAAIATFVTSLRISGATTRGVLTVDVNLLLYAFGMPLYAALTLASRSKSWRRNLALGYVVLVPCVAFGAFADFLKNVAITAAPAIAAQTGFAAWQREAIAFAFQLGSLILPAVAPAVLWVALNQRLLAVLRRGGESVSSA
jgi:hypothetical protein